MNGDKLFQNPDPIENLIPTYGEDLVPGYSQLDTSQVAAAADAMPVMSGIDMLRMAVPGTPGEDYPIYPKIPATSFSCEGRIEGGYYADVEARCQPFHICTADGSGALSPYSFLCPNGTLFNQEYFVCEYWFNVDCSKTESLYSLNEGIGDTTSGAASSPVRGFAPPSEPEDESHFLSSPVATELDESAAQTAAQPADDEYDAPDSAASAPLSSYEPTVDSYGAPSADVAPISNYSPPPAAPPQPQYNGNNNIRTGRVKSDRKKPVQAPRRPQPPPRRPKPAPVNKVKPSNKPRGGRTQFNEIRRPVSKLPVPAPVHRQPFFPQFNEPQPILTPIEPNRFNKPRQESRGGRTQNGNSLPSPTKAPPKPQTGYGAPPPDYDEPAETFYNSPAPQYDEPIEITTTVAPVEEYGPPPAAPQKDYSFALSSPQGVEPPNDDYDYEYEEEPLPTYKGSGPGGESNYIAPIVSAEEPVVVAALPAESPFYAKVTSTISDYDDEDPLPTYNRDAVSSSGQSYNAPGSESLYGAPPQASDALYGAPQPADSSYNNPPPVQTGYGAPPPDPVSVAATAPQAETGYGSPPPAQKEYGAPPQVETGYGAPPPAQDEYEAPPQVETGYGAPPPEDYDDDPLPTYTGGVYVPSNPAPAPAPAANVPQTGYGAPPPLPASSPVQDYGSPIVDLTIEVDDDPLPTYSPAPVSSNSVDSYTAPGAIDSYGAPTPDSYGLPAAAANPIESYGPPAASSVDSYSVPAAPTVDSYDSPAAPAINSYESPATPALDSYNIPAAPVLDNYDSPAAPALDSYDSPAAPALDSYDSPAAPALDSYDSPAASPLNSYESPAAPALSTYGPPPPASYNSRPTPTVDILPEYYKSEINLGLADPNDLPRIEPFLADYGKPPQKGPAPRAPRPPPPPPPPPSARPPRRKPLPPPDTGYGVPAAPPLGLPSYKASKKDHRGGFKRSLFRVYGR